MAPTMALSKAEQNALCVSYDVLGTHVELDLQFVKRYLVRGNPDKITDQEIVFFMNTCKMQKLNPLVAGEVYCIKFGNDPAQMVVGKGAYLRRAYEHPDYLCKEDGIVVLRNGEVIQKEGLLPVPRRTVDWRMVPGTLQPQRAGENSFQGGLFLRVRQGPSELEVQAGDHDLQGGYQPVRQRGVPEGL